MKILFIRPRPSADTIGLQHVMIVEPLELEVLASLCERDDAPAIIDMILEKRPLEYFIRRIAPDLFCVTGYITHVAIMKEYCRRVKSIDPRIRTVAGGVHCEVCPDDLDDPAIDFRVVRNATRAFPALLRHLKSGTPLPPTVIRPGGKKPEVDVPPYDFFFPTPDRTLTKQYRKRYFYIFHDRVACIKTSFGCPYRCTFCFCRKITGDLYRRRPLDEVLDELRGITEKEIYIVDDDFLVERGFVERFIDGLGRCGIRKRYLIYGRADFIAANPATIRRFAEAGLRTVIVGLESFFDEELAGYNKGTTAAMNHEALAILKSAKIDCFATVIVPPWWNRDHFRGAGEALRRLGVHYVNLQPYTPLPGTDSCAQYPEHELLIRRTDYERWDLAHVSVPPHHLSCADFYREILNLYEKILFQPRHLAGYLIRYTPAQLWKMALGSFVVWRQYQARIAAARRQPNARYGAPVNKAEIDG